MGLNRFKIGMTNDGKEIWKCPDCAKKGSLVEINYVTGTAKFTTLKETEKRIKCNTCGHIYCYDFKDIEKNRLHAKNAQLNTIGAFASAIGGTSLDMHAQSARAERSVAAIVDFSKCPKCNSSDTRELSKEEFQFENSRKNMPQVNNISIADELKKFKELLDLGVITQEEFDAQKKHLLSGNAPAPVPTQAPQPKEQPSIPSFTVSTPAEQPVKPTREIPTNPIVTCPVCGKSQYSRKNCYNCGKDLT